MAFNPTLINKTRQNITGAIGSRAYNGGNFGFDPRSIPVCKLWLDTSNSTNIITDVTPSITWNDLSIRSAGDVSGSATYTSNYIKFIGTQYLSASINSVCNLSTDDFAIFVVAKVPDTTTDQYILSKYSSANLHWELYFNGANNVVFSYTYASNTSKTVTSVGVTAGNNIVISVIVPRLMPFGTNIYINGVGSSVPVTSVATTLSNTSNLYIGVKNITTTYSNYLQSNIYEILMYRSGVTSSSSTTVMTRDQQQQIEGYLAWKWGLQQYLPSGSGLNISGFTLTSNTLTLSAASSFTDNASVLFTDPPAGLSVNTLYYVLAATTNSTGFQLTATSGGTSAISLPFTIAEYIATGNYNGWYGASYYTLTGYSTGTNTLIMSSRIEFSNSDIIIVSKDVAGLTGGKLYRAKLNSVASGGQLNEVGVRNYTTGDAITLTGSTPFTAYIIKNPTAIIVERWTGPTSANSFFSTADVVQGESIIFPSSYAGLSSNNQYYVYNSSNQDQTFRVYDSKYAISTLSGTSDSITAIRGSSLYNKNLARPTKPFLRPFLPVDISACQLWLDGADVSAISPSISGFTTWKDKSSGANNATVVVGTYTNYHNGSTVQETGILIANDGTTDSYLTIPEDLTRISSSTSITTVLVFNATAFNDRTSNLTGHTGGKGGQYLIGYHTGQTNNHWYSPMVLMIYDPNGLSGTPGPYIYAFQYDFTNSGTYKAIGGKANIEINNIYIVSYTMSGRTCSIYCNGSSVGTGTFSADTVDWGSTGTTRIGSSIRLSSGSSLPSNFAGYINEVISYDKVLSTSERQKVEGYLAWKWGSPDPNTINPYLAFIPTTHPFTNFPSATVVPY